MMEEQFRHTEDCLEYSRAAAKRLYDWVSLWPNYCRKCKGWGMLGSGIMDRDTGLVDTEPCDCADEGKCPRCGKEGWGGYEMTHEPCSHCEYDPKNPDGMPYELDAPCPCEMEWERKMMERYYNELDEYMSKNSA